MATITVLAPDYEADREADISLAARVAPTDPVTVVVINNGKPNAEQLLGYIAEGLRDRFPVAEVVLHSKSSAGKPIDADQAEMLAARAHMVISGLGD